MRSMKKNVSRKNNKLSPYLKKAKNKNKLMKIHLSNA